MIKDNEIIKWGRTMIRRGLQESIIALRHCDFNKPSYQDLVIMEKLSKAIEYFYHLQKVNRLTEKAFNRHYLQLRRRDETVSKLRKVRKGSHTYHAPLPKNFFRLEGGE